MILGYIVAIFAAIYLAYWSVNITLFFAAKILMPETREPNWKQLAESEDEQ